MREGATTFQEEASNVVARAEAQGLLAEARSTGLPWLLQDMAIATDDATARHALNDTLQLARRLGLSTYHAAYLELALRASLPLATLDADLRNALEKTGTRRF